jgi:hypothetical protein
VRIDSASASILETQRKAFFALRSSASSRLQLGFAVRRLRKATLAVVPISRRRRSGSCATAMMMAWWQQLCSLLRERKMKMQPS